MTGPPDAAVLATLPNPPRPITPKARWRSWAEQPVRIWLVLTAIVFAITAYFLITRVNEALNDRWLIAHGTPVVATFRTVDGDPHPGAKKHRPRDHEMPADIGYEMNGTQHVLIALQPKPFAYADVGGPFPIRVDPKEPTRWTEATEMVPWSQELAAFILLLPVCVLLIAVDIWKRQSVLNLWRAGELAAATVVAVRHTAVAPNGRLVRVHFNEADRRVFSILVPANQAPAKGDTIELLRRPQRPGRAILAKLYL